MANAHFLNLGGMGFKDLEALAALVIKEFDIVPNATSAAGTIVAAVKSKMPPLFTIIVTVGFFGLLLLLLFVTNFPQSKAGT